MPASLLIVGAGVLYFFFRDYKGPGSRNFVRVTYDPGGTRGVRWGERPSS